MGNGSSCTRVEQFDESVQMPSVSPEIRSSSSSSPLSQPYKIPPTKVVPAASAQEEGFKVKRNSDQYSTIWDLNSKVSS
jgi:hypothetical protein